MPKLTVKFHGVMAMVESTDGDQVALLLCKGDRALAQNHVGYIRFPERSYLSSSTRAPEPPRPKQPRELRHLLLRDERLTIIAKSDDPLSIDHEEDQFKSTTP